ncbi:MAG TPA: STAS domain-containing protein [Azospirillum sp.]|nr:STAS domain-containing protein [Azospirillum sp.]
MFYRKTSERHFARIDVTGRFTGQDGDGVRELITDIKQSPDRRYVVDLSRLDFIDSAGIGMLLVINGEAAAVGKALALVVTDGQVRKVAMLTRIGMIIPLHDSLADYLASSVPEAVLTPHPCAPNEDPLAIAARTLRQVIPA